MRVEVFDFALSGEDVLKGRATLADSVVLDPAWAAHAWETLVGFFGRTSEHGIPITLTLLRKALTEAKVELKSSGGYAEETRRLRELTDRNLSLLAVHDVLQLSSDLNEVIHVDRAAELDALRETVAAGHLLLTGEPGSGKSGLLHSLACVLRKSGTPVVVLLAEQILGRDWKGVANLPGFDRHPLDEILARWPSTAPGVLLTDALDAVRDPDAQRMLRGLLRDVQHGHSGWRVVTSVREFDLDHGRELREQFPGVGVLGFTSPRFSGVAHFHVPHLSDEQLDDLIQRHEQFRPFIQNARTSSKSENLHRSPFYLRLAAELMRAGVSPDRVADWTSPAILLRKYWEEHVTKEPRAAEVKHVMRAICAKMVEERCTVIAEQDLSLAKNDYVAIGELRSRGVLQSSPRAGGVLIGSDALGFTHHLLHDYAIATELIPKQPSDRLVKFVSRNPLLPVFYRQSFVFALEELWDTGEHNNRNLFWNTALQLENAPTLHSVTRIVAPVLAARRVESDQDLQPLLDALATESGGDSPSHGALRHLVSGFQDAHPDTIRGGAGSWLQFALELTRLLPDDATVEWPLVLLLDSLNSLDEKQPLPEHTLLNAAGRNLLAACLTPAASMRQRYSLNVAVVAICQSFAVAPAESREALLALLTEERLKTFPHHELSQLARSLHHLGREGDDIVLRLFDAVFTREQKPGDWENRGSILMSMRLQTSDLWNSIRHTLADYYGRLEGKNADLLTELACIVLNTTSRRSDDEADTDFALLTTISFRGVTCPLVEDFASFRGYSFDPNLEAITSHFRESLRVWAAVDPTRLDAALDRLARCARNSSMWSIFLELGAEHPESLGAKLEPVLAEPIFQIHEDYRYAGVELFGALHRKGDRDQRQRLEQLILTLPDRYHPWREADDALVERWFTAARKRLLGTLRDGDIVLDAIRKMKTEQETAGPLPTNERPPGIETFSHTFTDEETMEERGIKLAEPANAEMFRLRDELKHFLHRGDHPAQPEEIDRLWPVIEQSEQAIIRFGETHPSMSRELWGYLVGACAGVVVVMGWSPYDTRWITIRRLLLRASTDLDPIRGADSDDREDSLSWGWPAPRIDAAEGLPWLAFRLEAMDEPLTAALRELSGDFSTALRHNLTRRLFLLRKADSALMWEFLERFAAHEPRFNVLMGTVESLNRLWSYDEGRVLSLLAVIAKRASASAPDDHKIHDVLAGAQLFHYLQTGSVASKRYVEQLIEVCDGPRVSSVWSEKLHACRAGGWLTLGSGAQPTSDENAARQRTWAFFLDLLTAARTKLAAVRIGLRLLGPDTTLESEGVRQQVEKRDRLGRLLDGIAMQIYFASGAYAEQRPSDKEKLSPAGMRRFWKDAEPCLTSLADELHPSVAYHLVQTLAHLLPCAPAEIFLLAARSIQTSANGGGFQHESQAVREVVKLVQRILADYPDLLAPDNGEESAVFTALLDVLDLFVEAGWSEARHLTHHLEEIYR